MIVTGGCRTDSIPVTKRTGSMKKWWVTPSQMPIRLPYYDGNGMYLSMGNISANGQVGLLSSTLSIKPEFDSMAKPP